MATAQNLVPNHSFEVPDSCPATHTFLALGEGPLQWFSGGGTPDYFQSCVPPPNEASVPLHDYAYQYPQDGENCIGLITYEVNSGGIREYAMVQLSTPLVAGQTYGVSFYANAAWNGTDSMHPQMNHASSHVGALFTMQPRPWTGFDPWPLATGNAQVFHPWIIADTVNWTLVSGSFVADSAYQYLMVGNHYDNSITDTISLGPSIQLPRAYTLVDNVCVSPSPSGCELNHEINEIPDIGPMVFPNPAQNELVIQNANGAEAGVFDAVGRRIWQGLLVSDRWGLDVRAWSRGAYVLRLKHLGAVSSHRFVLID